MSGAIGNLFVVFVFSVDTVRHVLMTVRHAIVTFGSEVFALLLV